MNVVTRICSIYHAQLLNLIKQPYTPLSSPGGGGVLDWERVQRGAGHVQTYPDRPDRRHPQRAASAHEWDLHRRYLRISTGVCVPFAVVTHVLLQPPGFTSMFPWEAGQRIRGDAYGFILRRTWILWISFQILGSVTMSLPPKVMRDGVLEKRSSGLLQLWKKKRCVLTEDGLRLHRHKAHNDAPTSALSSKAKDLPFAHMATVDCVEYKRGLVYFTVVLTSGKEIDFRCAQEGTAWNAEIALALVRYKNLQAVLTGRNKHLSTALLDTDQENVALWTGTKMRVWFLLGGDTATRKQPYRSKIKGFSSNMLLNAPFGYDAWYINGYHPGLLWGQAHIIIRVICEFKMNHIHINEKTVF